MKKLTIEEFGNITASKEPVPGGGSMSALCGSLSGALTEMVANLTLGRKKYSDVEEEMAEISQQAHILRQSLLEDIENDAKAYQLVMDAYGLPKASDQEKEIRLQAIQDGLKEASKTPLEIAKKAFEIEELAAVVVAKGNKNARTDGLVATMLARTAVLSACQNVKINLDSIKDESFKKEFEDEVYEYEKDALQLESLILSDYAL